jgi:hypothetical protein
VPWSLVGIALVKTDVLRLAAESARACQDPDRSLALIDEACWPVASTPQGATSAEWSATCDGERVHGSGLLPPSAYSVGDCGRPQVIAKTLSISEKAVSVHVSNLTAKLGVSNRLEAVAPAHQLEASEPAGVTDGWRGGSGTRVLAAGAKDLFGQDRIFTFAGVARSRPAHDI